MPARSQHERPQKILLAMYELAGGTTKSLKYEDIVVKAFERFPDEFALRGYPQFPDASDIHKPLYGPLKRLGLVRSGGKTFALTSSGVEEAKRLTSNNRKVAGGNADRLSRDLEHEIERMVRSDAFQLYAAGTGDRILDTDFYAFLGCTVRTPRNDFLGRLEISGQAVEAAARLERPDAATADLLEKVWTHLRERFSELIRRKTEKG